MENTIQKFPITKVFQKLLDQYNPHDLRYSSHFHDKDVDQDDRYYSEAYKLFKPDQQTEGKYFYCDNPYELDQRPSKYP